jgi:hypothetical protein
MHWRLLFVLRLQVDLDGLGRGAVMLVKLLVLLFGDWRLSMQGWRAQGLLKQRWPPSSQYRQFARGHARRSLYLITRRNHGLVFQNCLLETI